MLFAVAVGLGGCLAHTTSSIELLKDMFIDTFFSNLRAFFILALVGELISFLSLVSESYMRVLFLKEK